jgi:thiol-disulfide isomerase/thioredoxin
MKPMVVGRIHANWCGHCKDLIPEWAKMKKQLGPKKYKFVSIEQSNEGPHLERLNKYLGIVEEEKKVKMKEGYPTIFKALNGRVEYYEGPRMAETGGMGRQSCPGRNTQRTCESKEADFKDPTTNITSFQTC